MPTDLRAFNPNVVLCSFYPTSGPVLTIGEGVDVMRLFLITGRGCPCPREGRVLFKWFHPSC